MTEKERTYIAIDLKSFYASVECKERNRDPLTTNLVVADKSRTEKSQFHRFAEQYLRIHIQCFCCRIREMISDITHVGGAQQGIANGMYSFKSKIFETAFAANIGIVERLVGNSM